MWSATWQHSRFLAGEQVGRQLGEKACERLPSALVLLELIGIGARAAGILDLLLTHHDLGQIVGDLAASAPEIYLAGGLLSVGHARQRVAIARAIAYQPKLLLMDEPFASVDAQTRADLEDLVATVRDQFRITIVVVTHDIDEAVYLSDRVVVLSKSPSFVLDLVATELPRPRDQITTKALPEFVAKRSAIARLIRRPDSTYGSTT